MSIEHNKAIARRTAPLILSFGGGVSPGTPGANMAAMADVVVGAGNRAVAS